MALFLSTPLVAQDATNTVPLTKPAEIQEPPDYRPWTIGAGVGTDGLIGTGVSWRFSDHLGVRAGIGYAEATWNNLGIGGLHYDTRLRLLDEPLTLDFYPWRKRSFRVSLGMWFNQNELSGTVSSTGTIIVNGSPVVVPAGSFTMRLEQQPVNPYLSIGGNLFYFDHAHRWALAGELGIVYTGSPHASVDRTASAILSDSTVNEIKSSLEHYAEDYRWWPIAKLAVTFSF
jgi:hypothetical protein